MPQKSFRQKKFEKLKDIKSYYDAERSIKIALSLADTVAEKIKILDSFITQAKENRNHKILQIVLHKRFKLFEDTGIAMKPDYMYLYGNNFARYGKHEKAAEVFREIFKVNKNASEELLESLFALVKEAAYKKKYKEAADLRIEIGEIYEKTGSKSFAVNNYKLAVDDAIQAGNLKLAEKISNRIKKIRGHLHE